MIAGWLNFISLFVCASCYTHQKPATLVQWNENCVQDSLALNDCNWCKCKSDRKYTCNARVCSEVDVFGHFNDAIAAIDVGMEGRGVWRSTKLACEPGVQYRRTDLVCICSAEGTWPNPVCRDVFRVLYLVQATEETKPKQQKCSPTKLYLIGCNVCFCPSTGIIDANMCTKKTCTGEDDILEIKEERTGADEGDNGEEVAIYATCSADKMYKLGCKTCVCMRNNRLHCDRCESLEQPKNLSTYCGSMEPGEIYTADCNLCFCDSNGYSYCSVKKCLPGRRTFARDPYKGALNLDEILEEKTIQFNSKCDLGTLKKEKCKTCTCFAFIGGTVTYSCTYNSNEDCAPELSGGALRSGSPLSLERALQFLNSDCVVDTTYEHNCFICGCSRNDKGEKYEICETNPKCENTTVQDLEVLHGYCEPLHVYKKDCNLCMCLIDGKTVRCTSHVCDTVQPLQEPVSVQVVPVTQVGDPCPNGSSYKIDCNVCFCLNNGNAICTTIDCKKSSVT